MIRSVFALLFLFILPFASPGQDYLVTVKGDTLRGEILLLSYDIIDRAEIKIGKKKNSLTALQVKSAHLKGDTYHSIKKDNRYAFMKLLKAGYLSLYAYKVDKLLGYDGRYLVKRDGSAMELPNLTFRKVMADFLSDCAYLKQSLEEGDLGKKDLEKIMDEYNSCINKKTVTELVVRQDSTASNYSPELQALEKLRKQVDSTSDLANKGDALDVLKNMEEKIKANQPVPKFMVDGLRGYLGETVLKDETEKFIQALKKN